MRNSIQKQMILDALHELHHPTAHAVCERIQQTYPNISLATVYRNLNKMAEKHLVTKVTLPNGSDRFELHAAHHYHALCTQCGKVVDVHAIPELLLETLDRDVATETGFQLNLHYLLFEGICADCAAAQMESTEP